VTSWLVEWVRAMSATDPYRPPTTEERADAVAALQAVLAGHQPRVPDGLQLAVHDGFTLLTAGFWGAIALRNVIDLVIEVPHPGSDRLTARLGHDLFHAIPTAALLIAGTHRKAADNAADVAHRTDSLFHTFAQTLATTEIQLHGFAQASAPDTDAVISPGAGDATERHDALEKTLTRQGFRVRHHEHLAGRTNVQGIAAAARGAPFLHLELAPPLRLHHRDAVVKAVADTWHQQGHHQEPGQRGTGRDQERHPEARQ
jgi:hypothetical protein